MFESPFEIFQQNDTIMIAHNNTKMPSNAKNDFQKQEKNTEDIGLNSIEKNKSKWIL